MNKIIIFAVIIILILITLFILINNREEALVSTSEEELSDEEGAALENGQDYLDMQGYYLYPPEGYTCEGGFTDGYRYLDAECVPEGRDDYEINVGAGLASSGIDPEKGLVANQIVVRSSEFTNRQYGVYVCEEHTSEELKLDAEHYLCTYNRDNQPIITLGIGKSFYHPQSSFGRWFEAEMIIKENDETYTQEDYIDLLEKFVNSSVKINWEDYKPEE